MATQTIPESFEVGTPQVICRWRLSKGMLPATNRHMRALSSRMLSGHAPTPELLAWVKQHIEWTLPEGAAEHPDGVLMLAVDTQGRAAMAVGAYEALPDTSTYVLVQRAQTARVEAQSTGVAPEVLWAVQGSMLVCGLGAHDVLSGVNSLLYDVARTLTMDVTFEPALPDLVAQHDKMASSSADKKTSVTAPYDELFLASDEYGVVSANGASGSVSAHFEQDWARLLDATGQKSSVKGIQSVSDTR